MHLRHKNYGKIITPAKQFEQMDDTSIHLQMHAEPTIAVIGA